VEISEKMSASNGVKIIYGGGGFSSDPARNRLPDGTIDPHRYAKTLLDTLGKNGVKIIDTAEIYTGSEAELGYQEAHKDFIIDTKIAGIIIPGRGKDEVIEAGKKRLELLKTSQVDILYFHSPDITVPWKEQLAGANELYKQGAFKRLGVSNYTPQQVQEVYDVAEQNGFVKPTVFQGNYNAVARLIEDDLFPVLRKLKISFYAYSPIAGGFLAKTSQQVRDGHGRFNPEGPLSAMYSLLYSKPSFFAALDEWDKIASDAGIKKVELAYRWITYHSALKGDFGDGVIFGAALTQVDETVAAIRAGPLPSEIVSRIESLWPSIKGDALVDNFAAMTALAKK